MKIAKIQNQFIKPLKQNRGFNFYQNHSNSIISFKRVKPIGQDYYEQFNKLLNINKKELYKHLDIIEIENGYKKINILDSLNNLFENKNIPVKNMKIFHKTEESRDNILLNGFRVKYDSVMKFGPGISFSNDSNTLKNNSGKLIEAKFTGNAAIYKDFEKYRSIQDAVSKQVLNFMGINSFEGDKTIIEHIAASKFANEYLNNKLINELGVDGAFIDNSTYSFVAFNPECIDYISYSNSVN